LAEIQTAMQDKEELRELLALRGMQTFDKASTRQSFQDRNDVVFIDWACFKEKIILVAARLTHTSTFEMWDVGVTASEVANWKQNNLRFLDEDEGRLRELDLLTGPLEEFTTNEDLLILSPTDPLHGIPLHALLIGDKILIDRNRVIYSPSLLILRQCMERSVPTDDWHSVVFGNPTSDKRHGTESAKDLASLFRCEAKVGPDANLECFRDLAPSAKLIHYHGHARFDADDGLQSALILAGKARLTARDVFALPLMASLVTLIACSSGVQQINPGDEPTGLVPAFLCAGANAVVGTLWPVQDIYGKEFSKLFYSGFSAGGTIDIARVLQEAVLEMRKRHPEPRCWASFTLYGDWVLKNVPKFSAVQ